MTFLQIKNLVYSRAGDQGWFETASSGLTTDPRLVSEIQAAYENAVNILDEHHAFVVYDEENVAFAANESEKNLKTVLANSPRKLLSAYIYPNNDTTKEPLPIHFPRRGNRQRARQSRYSYTWPSTAQSQNTRLMYLRGHYILGFINKGTNAQTVSIGYAPVAETLSADGDIPAQVPLAHHEYIAQRAAVNLVASEGGDARAMISILDNLEERLRSTGASMNAYSFNIPGIY